MNWNAMDSKRLAYLYHDKESQLQQRLLQGASWQEVSVLRKNLTRLATILYSKLNPGSGNPAEQASRITGNRGPGLSPITGR